MKHKFKKGDKVIALNSSKPSLRTKGKTYKILKTYQDGDVKLTCDKNWFSDMTQTEVTNTYYNWSAYKHFKKKAKLL